MNHSSAHKESQPKAIKSNIPFFSPMVQKKLSVGSVNDSYEVEADNMATKVMRMSEPSVQNYSHTGALVQRKCTACEQEEKIQKKALAENITPLIQRASDSESGGVAPSHVESQINSSRGGGSSLDNGTKSFMESRFGTDFSDVKIHTGSQAVQMSRELNAQAFTVGNDIYFNEGKYSPNSDSGKHLLAHELTHTVQQMGGIGRKIQKQEEGTTETSPSTTTSSIPTSIVCSPTPLSRADFLARNGNDVSELGHTSFLLNRNLLSPDTIQYQQVTRGRFKLLPIQVNLPSIDSIYTQVGRFTEGSHRFEGSPDCIADDYPIEWRIASSGADKIREGEQEHCNDYNLAYQLCILPLVQNVNRLASTSRTFRSEISAKREITRLIGFNPDDWFDKFRCLLQQSLVRDSISRRQVRGSHTPNVQFSAPDRHNHCRAITVTISGSSLREIGTQPSSSIIDLNQC